jgi:putative drug exporter of the RND superfamily
METTDRRNETQSPGRLGRLAALAYRRRRFVVVSWIVLLIGIMALAPRIAGEFTADYAAPGSDSRAARELVEQRFGGYSGESIDVVWEADAGADSPEVRREMDNFISRAERLEGIASAQPAQVSRDGSIAVERLRLDRPASEVPTETADRLLEMSDEANDGAGLEVALGGGPIQQAEGGPGPETVGLAAAAAVLLVAFGSLVAVGFPMAVALFGLGISSALITVLAAIVDVPEWATALAGLIGIGVGVDYALLVLTRFRNAIDAGSETEAAVAEAVTTAGRSVLVAGSTVIISLLGLFTLGLGYMNGAALSASLAVLVVMAAAVTLLPALLGFAGRAVNRFHVPLLGGRRAGAQGGAFAARWSRVVQRRPWTTIAVGTALLAALTLPVLGLRLGFPDAGNDRPGNATREAYDMVAQGFGEGANGPLTVVAELPGPDARDEVASAAREIRTLPDVAAVSAPQLNRDGDAALLVVTPRSSPQEDATETLVHDLRERVLPSELGTAGIPAYVGGTTALAVDQGDYVADRLPLFVGAVVVLSLLLLIAAFRAPLLAAKAGVMNLLSVGAAFGVIALFAQGGFFGELIGIDQEVPIAPFVPVLMFAILFGLSMDYEVFLLSRVREEYLRLGSPSDAVTDGLRRTARVITAAAAIMVVVFLAFVVSDDTFLRLIGVGMATAILVDATIVRMALVPAIMQLLGRASWWIPRWLDRVVPRLDHEPGAAVVAPAVRERPAET